MPQERRGARSETQDERKSLVDRPKLIGVEATSGTAKTLRVNHRGLLDEDTRLSAVEGDGWSKGCRTGSGRGR